MAATLEERIPLSTQRTAADGGCTILRTFQSSGKASTLATSSFSNTDNTKTLNVLNTRNSSASLVSTSTSNTGPETAASKSNLLKAAQGPPAQTQEREREERREGERESQVDGGNTSDEGGLVMREPLECPSDRTQSDDEELWMGPWNNLHIPMTKL